ncbi:DNA repair protein [Micromonospora sp. FIMYZ51]|uniref:DNA repair protein n=1 Tax=Micromonospora sp. FIMYZ51 TaxID=3051832 RepID=UPI00311DC175
MPIQPNDRCQQDTERIWRGRTRAGRFPAQPPHRDHRIGGLSWHELNELPAAATQHRLNTR